MLRSIFVLAAAIALAIIVVNVFFQVLGALLQLAAFLLLAAGAYWLFLRLKAGARRG